MIACVVALALAVPWVDVLDVAAAAPALMVPWGDATDVALATGVGVALALDEA